jgi:succinyl-CoA synthetase beta subunit
MPDAAPFSNAQALQLLEQYAIPLARQALVQTPAQAVQAAQQMGLPVALKLIAPASSHKTEAGFVVLNLAALEEVERAARDLLKRGSDTRLEGLLVQEMVCGGVEFIAGISHDAQFGQVVLIGSGGILVELLDDVAIAVPPLTHAQAFELIRQTKAIKLLQGFRGRPMGDMDGLIDLVVRLSQLALDHADTISAVDLNPVIVLPAGFGVKVVDYRIFGIV